MGKTFRGKQRQQHRGDYRPPPRPAPSKPSTGPRRTSIAPEEHTRQDVPLELYDRAIARGMR